MNYEEKICKLNDWLEEIDELWENNERKRQSFSNERDSEEWEHYYAYEDVINELVENLHNARLNFRDLAQFEQGHFD